MLNLKTWLQPLGLALLIGTQAPAALAVTGLSYVSTSGDYIGQGLSQTLKPTTVSVTASGDAGSAHVQITNASLWWDLDFAAPQGTALLPGSYANAARYPFQSPMGAGLSMGGNGRGCNLAKGWFKVLEYRRNSAGQLTRLAIDFVQNCEVNGPPLYGAVRYNSPIALKVPTIAAVAGNDAAVLPGETVTLDGRQSFSRRFAMQSYQWVQVDGPAVTLTNPASLSPTFVAPQVSGEGASLRFQLTVTNRKAETAVDDVVIFVQGPNAPRTEVKFHGDVGDYITGGRSYTYNPQNASISFSRNFAGGVSASISGDAWWTLDTAVPSGKTFRPGTYKNATRFPFQAATAPGLNLSGDGRGCNLLTGKFIVYQAKFDTSGKPTQLEMDFEQRCEGSSAAAYGTVLLNAVPHTTLARQLRQARERFAAQDAAAR